MSGGQTRSARRLVARRKRAAEQLRREVMGADGSLHRSYFRTFQRQLAGKPRRISAGDVVVAASRADLIYVGDFHAVPACQEYAAELLEQVARRVPRLALGVEFAYSRQQRLLEPAVPVESMEPTRVCGEGEHPVLIQSRRPNGTPELHSGLIQVLKKADKIRPVHVEVRRPGPSAGPRLSSFICKVARSPA